MALAFRTTDRCSFVHVSDDAATVPAEHDGRWLPAAGQPAGCDVITVRPMSKTELLQVGAADSDEAVIAAFWPGVISIAGQSSPDWRTLPPWLVSDICTLLAALAHGAVGPLGRSSSTAPA